MAITISFTRGAERRPVKQRNKGVQNLLSLLAMLPDDQIILLDSIGTNFHFHNRKKDSGASDYPEKSIEQSLIEFSRFDYKNKPKPSHNQRWALATLKEEVIHYLAEHLAFDRSIEWKLAAAQELDTPNSNRKKLLKAQRKYDSAKSEVKLSPAEYEKDITSQDITSDVLHGEWEPAEELLVNLSLVRDYLRTTCDSENAIQQKMQEAFPHTYALALQFESQVRQRTEQIVESPEQKTILAQNSVDSLHQSWSHIKDAAQQKKR